MATFYGQRYCAFSVHVLAHKENQCHHKQPHGEHEYGGCFSFFFLLLFFLIGQNMMLCFTLDILHFSLQLIFYTYI